MNEGQVLDIARQAMLITFEVGAPMLLASLVVGLVISLFQSVTQIQEVTLTFVPKLAAIAVVLLVAGHWMLGQMVAYVQHLFGQITSLLG